jgi:hypothetical protein
VTRPGAAAWRIGGSLIAALMFAFGTANAVGALYDSRRLPAIDAPVRVVTWLLLTGGSIHRRDPVGDDVTIDRERGPRRVALEVGGRTAGRERMPVVRPPSASRLRDPRPRGRVQIARDGSDVVASNVHGDLSSPRMGQHRVRNVEAIRPARVGRRGREGGGAVGGSSSVVGRRRRRARWRRRRRGRSSDGGDVRSCLGHAGCLPVDVSSDGDTAAAIEPTQRDRVITASSDGGDVIVRYRAD